MGLERILWNENLRIAIRITHFRDPFLEKKMKNAREIGGEGRDEQGETAHYHGKKLSGALQAVTVEASSCLNLPNFPNGLSNPCNILAAKGL